MEAERPTALRGAPAVDAVLAARAAAGGGEAAAGVEAGGEGLGARGVEVAPVRLERISSDALEGLRASPPLPARRSGDSRHRPMKCASTRPIRDVWRLEVDVISRQLVDHPSHRADVFQTSRLQLRQLSESALVSVRAASGAAAPALSWLVECEGSALAQWSFGSRSWSRFVGPALAADGCQASSRRARGARRAKTPSRRCVDRARFCEARSSRSA